MKRKIVPAHWRMNFYLGGIFVNVHLWGRRKVAPIFIALIILIITMTAPLAAFASHSGPKYNGDSLPALDGSGYQSGYGGLLSDDFGVRVTLVDAQTGEKIYIDGYMPASIDYINQDIYNRGYIGGRSSIPSVAFENVTVLGGLCKSDYVLSGAALSNSKGYRPKSPPVPKDDSGNTFNIESTVLPRTLSVSGDQQVNLGNVKKYFTNRTVLDSFAQLIGTDYATVSSGKYKLLIEPVAYIIWNSSLGYAATPTELALADLAGVRPTGVYDEGWFARKFNYIYILNNFPKSLVLSEPWLNYSSGPFYTETYDIGGGNYREGYRRETILNHMAMSTISWDPQGTPIYYHTYEVQVQIPDDTSLADLRGKPFAEQLEILKDLENPIITSRKWLPKVDSTLTDTEPAVAVFLRFEIIYHYYE